MSDVKMYNPNDKDYIDDVLKKLEYQRKKSNTLFKGIVRTILNGKIQDDLISNIVTGTGRMFSAQKVFNTKLFSDTDYRSWSVTHFGFGQGGAVIVGSTANIISPDGCDQDLNDPITMCDETVQLGYLTSPGDSYKNVLQTPRSIKPIGIGNTSMLQASDINCQYGQVHSYVRCNCIKSIGEPNYLQNDTDFIIINECGLFYSNLVNTRLFSHICFPPQNVQKKSEFVIEWYILC